MNYFKNNFTSACFLTIFTQYADISVMSHIAKQLRVL